MTFNEALKSDLGRLDSATRTPRSFFVWKWVPLLAIAGVPFLLFATNEFAAAIPTFSPLEASLGSRAAVTLPLLLMALLLDLRIQRFEVLYEVTVRLNGFTELDLKNVNSVARVELPASSAAYLSRTPAEVGALSKWYSIHRGAGRDLPVGIALLGGIIYGFVFVKLAVLPLIDAQTHFAASSAPLLAISMIGLALTTIAINLQRGRYQALWSSLNLQKFGIAHPTYRLPCLPTLILLFACTVTVGWASISLPSQHLLATIALVCALLFLLVVKWPKLLTLLESSAVIDVMSGKSRRVICWLYPKIRVSLRVPLVLGLFLGVTCAALALAHNRDIAALGLAGLGLALPLVGLGFVLEPVRGSMLSAPRKDQSISATEISKLVVKSGIAKRWQKLLAGLFTLTTAVPVLEYLFGPIQLVNAGLS